MKKLILILLGVTLMTSINAQEKGKIRVGGNLGLSIPHAGIGLGGDLDIRYNIMDNVNAGIKFTGDILMKDLSADDVNQTVSMTASSISSTLLTGDYYFSKGTSMFAPYLGGGLGLYKIGNIEVTGSGTDTPSAPTNTSDFEADRKFGALLRGGFELGHARLGLEYFIIPKSTLVDINNNAIGTTSNGFVKLSLGFYLGGGKWRK